MDIEAARLQPSDRTLPPPPRPPHFDHRYVLPQHRTKLLEEKNSHPRDKRIIFYEEPHIYTVDGFPVQASVSGLASEFESEFDPEKGIMLMKISKKQSWPRLEYVIHPQKVGKVEDVPKGCGCLLINEKGETVASAEADPTTGMEESLLYSATTILTGKEVVYAYERGMTDEEIRQKWEKNGEDARNRGTEAHLQMELWFNSEPVREEEGEVQVGLNFVRKCLLPIGAVAFRTEWTIFGEDENVAGCIDLALRLPSGDVYLVDWKRSEKLESKMYGYSKMRSPLGHLEDCSGCAYALQLSCYQYIIEKYYGMKVAGRALASIHPDKPFVTSVPYLGEEAKYLMARKRAMARARNALSDQEENAALFCSLSGKVVMEAVRDEAGRLYDSKMAKLRNVRTSPCSATTEKATNAVLEKMARVEMGGDVRAWRDVFPRPTEDMMAFS